MHKIIYISLLLIIFLGDAAAQKKIIYRDTSLLQKEEPNIPPAVIDDTLAETVPEKTDTVLYQNNLYLPADSIKNWKNVQAYAYTNYLDSLLRNKKRAAVKATPPSAGPGIVNSILNSSIAGFFFWSVAILFVLFIIYRLFLAEGVFQRNSTAVKNGQAEVEEELITNESDFDTLIRTALQNGNYRQAVRYQYLRTLHTLAGKNIIELAPDKTNYQYVRELTNRSYQHEFAALTLNYEYVWYGEFEIDKNIYQKIENNFISLHQKLLKLN